jgi:HAD superfamily phosphatase
MGRVLGIVTGRPREEAEWTLDKFGWERWFPLLVAKEQQDGRTKPDPFCLQKAIAMFEAAGTQLEPYQVAYVGDSIDDMKAARRADVWPIGVVPPYQDASKHFARLDDAGAEFVLDSANKLRDRLNGIPEDEGRRARARA